MTFRVEFTPEAEADYGSLRKAGEVRQTFNWLLAGPEARQVIREAGLDPASG